MGTHKGRDKDIEHVEMWDVMVLKVGGATGVEILSGKGVERYRLLLQNIKVRRIGLQFEDVFNGG
jgi:hypothetical protein